MKRKPVYLDTASIGSASTIAEAADLAESLGYHADTRHISEGPDGFYLSASLRAVPIQADEARL